MRKNYKGNKNIKKFHTYIVKWVDPHLVGHGENTWIDFEDAEKDSVHVVVFSVGFVIVNNGKGITIAGDVNDWESGDSHQAFGRCQFIPHECIRSMKRIHNPHAAD